MCLVAERAILLEEEEEEEGKEIPYHPLPFPVLNAKRGEAGHISFNMSSSFLVL